MVTNLTEGDKLKCSRYFPESADKPLVAGDFTVTLASTQKLSGYMRNELVLTRGKERRTVMHFWCAEEQMAQTSEFIYINIQTLSATGLRVGRTTAFRSTRRVKFTRKTYCACWTKRAST
jgi:hypothetical protein